MHRNNILALVLICGVLVGVMGVACSGSDSTSPDTERIQIQLEGQLGLTGFITDVWGYQDPVTGIEYALVGFGISQGGVYVVDVSDASNPVLVSTVNTVPGFDVKVWRNYIYTVTGSATGRGGIVDLSDPRNPAVRGFFASAHNIYISEDGYMFLESPGLRIMDLNEDPTNPALVWQGGVEGHDATVIGDRLYDFHGSKGTNIYDISTISSPQLLGAIIDPRVRYHHSGWPTADGNYLLICDEGSRHPAPDITMWDIHAPGNPSLADSYSDSTAIVHNLYVKGDLAFVAYYNDGFKLFDLSTPGELHLLDEYDTNALSGEAFQGAFGIYPFSNSGYIYVSDVEHGLFIFSLTGTSSNNGGIVAP